jgi:hypothetical protein
VGTSSTLTITFAAGQTVTGTFIVSSGEVAVSNDKNQTYVATFTPSGTITYDVAA